MCIYIILDMLHIYYVLRADSDPRYLANFQLVPLGIVFSLFLYSFFYDKQANSTFEDNRVTLHKTQPLVFFFIESTLEIAFCHGGQIVFNDSSDSNLCLSELIRNRCTSTESSIHNDK